MKTVTAAEVHSDFDTAEQRILDKAKEIIELSNTDKSERLKAIGFTQSKTVVEAENSEHQRQVIGFVEKYKFKYPLLKFITEDELENICEKYGLVWMDVSNYLMDVPEKNLKEIENAKPLDDEDKFEVYTFGFFNFRIDDSGNMVNQEPIKVRTDDNLYIAAPKHHFNMKGKKKKGKFQYVDEDPIVLRKIKGGFQILTMWGDEASDEALVNTINN